MRWKTLARTIGKNIRKLREERGLTQERAAERTKERMSARQWQHLERGDANLTIKSLIAVARALKIDPKKLLG